ncbi:DUF2868 domain-containing protein [Mesosutterella sp. AGMB02718]|uniref:DUF2868 domain-containing protein n=1 Tax=Mesosutterella faecium TaxID=2925194 RepID=A0ABT7IJL6_9BURK|nr:DUF2868 domain-containing protein [Mesosutterella sp. AGMB02718]MDL2058568.1 DUF2868 domain-containing protein [Mesosutterella sp. AGMB02718]
MAFFSGKIPGRLKYPIETARTVCLVKAVETSEAGKKYWSQEEASQVTRDLLSETSRSTPPARFIEQRAQLAYSRMAKKSHTLRTLRFGGSPALGYLTSAAIILCAYLIGAFAERFFSSGSEVNLFSPVYGALCLWSLFIYALMIVYGALSLVRRRHMELPFRTVLARLTSGLVAPKLISSGLRRAFLAIWAPACLRLAQFRIARVFHWAFLALTAGVASSLIVRGLGGTYIIGWELPLFDSAPDRVCELFSRLWGWIPQALNLPPLPDVEGVAAMRLDRIAAAPEAASRIAPASAWMPRLFLLALVLIVIPRLLLIAWDSAALRLLKRRVAIPVDDYFRSLLEPGEEHASGPAPEPAAAGAESAAGQAAESSPAAAPKKEAPAKQEGGAA